MLKVNPHPDYPPEEGRYLNWSSGVMKNLMLMFSISALALVMLLWGQTSMAAEIALPSPSYSGATYTHIEAGHVGQNIFLQAEAIGLKAGIVGAFNNRGVVATMGLPPSHDPLLIMPVGYSG